jgi:hypothetical protein
MANALRPATAGRAVFRSARKKLPESRNAIKRKTNAAAPKANKKLNKKDIYFGAKFHRSDCVCRNSCHHKW